MNNRVRAAVWTVGYLSGVVGLGSALGFFILWLNPTGPEVMTVFLIGVVAWLVWIMYTIMYSHFESVDKSK